MHNPIKFHFVEKYSLFDAQSNYKFHDYFRDRLDWHLFGAQSSHDTHFHFLEILNFEVILNHLFNPQSIDNIFKLWRLVTFQE